jgi:hypothetical protein
LRQSAVIEDTDYRTPRGLDRALFAHTGSNLRGPACASATMLRSAQQPTQA